MNQQNCPDHRFSAARVVAVTFGVLGGIGSVIHGVGETLQGNVAPSGIFFNSWTQGPIATNTGGEQDASACAGLLGSSSWTKSASCS